MSDRGQHGGHQSLWILRDGVPELASDVYIWGYWFEESQRTHERRVALTTVGDITVSTVFTAIDHSYGYSPVPILYETMIFGGEEDAYQERYATREEAEEGHIRAVEMVQELLLNLTTGNGDT